ncbi:CDP-alcohol phosphatidyltransferase family protein [Clostridium cellulovorans]|uniref:Phosphatidylglycerophosphate synthase n=1 Tax=Clostridium cellulovorans (strain ATCC 35296 / DSM 3052 / OCM 3 / 743B) TaxID=573061 RepID=D9SM42_CLOC7|nr:CDP-alcohol phosphatidyltransferase family protein [Clostridium cellulovorans]ADL51773.1 CDP-alcohol phosphatidyltransferase [Clostridium cellulovorans 743B]
MSDKKIFTLPNLLSVLRIMLIPFFLVYFLNGQIKYSLFFLVLSGISDVLDGYIARKFNQTSELGKILDPIGDKLTQISIVLGFAILYEKARPILAIFALKELAMIIGGIIIFKNYKAVPGSQWWGKFATTLFYISVFIILMLGKMLSENQIIIILTIAVMTMVFALVKYIPFFKKEMKK